MKGKNQKLKLLYLAKIMQEQTDDTHALTMSEILAELAKHDILAQRKSIYEDLAALDDYGIEIIKERDGSKTLYHCGNRTFEIAELKFLVDAIQSSKFISEKKTRELIKKLEENVKLHFDIAQKNTIIWESEEEIPNRLYNRIKATIG